MLDITYQIVLAGEVPTKLALSGEDVHAVVAVEGRGQADVVTPEMLSNARTKLPDLLATLRTFEGMAFKEVKRKFVQRFVGVVVQTTVRARHSGRRFVFVEKTFDEGQHVVAERFASRRWCCCGRLTSGGGDL